MQRIFALLCLFIISSHSYAAEHFNVFEDWQTLEGADISVTHKSEQAALAQETLRIAQAALPQLEQFFDWYTKAKIHITLSDQQDLANGYASPLPYNRVVLYTASPSGVNALQDYNVWLETLIIHELTHIVHLDKARDLALFPRSIFGRNFLTFPNLFQPNFFKEGIATYIETSWEQEIGRGQSAYFDMVMRTEVASGVLPLSKAQQNIRDWPLDKAYSYGVLFYQFLEERYSQASIQGYIRTYSGQLFPFVVDRPARHNANQAGLSELWLEYSAWLEERYALQIKALLAGQADKLTPLSNSGYFNDSPIVSSDGTVYFVAFDRFGPTTVVRSSNGQGSDQGSYKVHDVGRALENEDLFRVHTGTKLVGADQNNIYYLQRNFCTHNSQSYDLYRYDFKQESSEQLSYCGHYLEGEIRDETLIAVKVKDNLKQLVLFDLNTQQETLVLQGAPNLNISSPSWRDAQNIVFTDKTNGRSWQVKTLDLTQGQSSVRSLLKSTGVNYFEVKAKPDSNELLVTSDAQSVIETWAYSLADGTLKRLTQTLGGSTQARYSKKDNTLVYRAYTENGWDIHTRPYATIPETEISQLSRPKQPGKGFEADWTALEQPDPKATEQSSAAEAEDPSSHDYRALDTLAPQSWFFGFGSDNAQTTVSLMLSGRDELNFHNWSLIGGRDVENDLNVFQAAYTAYNHLSLLYSRDHDYAVGGANAPAGFVDKARLIQSNEDFSALIHTRLHLDFSQILLFAGGNQQERDSNDLAAPINSYNLKVKTAGVGALYDSTYSALYGISPSYGRRILALAEQDYLSGSSSSARATSNGEVWSVDWHEYFNLYQAHTLALRAFHGYAADGADYFDLGDGPSFSGYEQNLIHRREYPMRGYPDRSDELRGQRPRLYSAEYRFPVLEVDEGFASWPLGMKNLHGAVFYESGKAQSATDYFDSAGAELSLNLDLGFGLLPLSIKAGFAQPFAATLSAPDKDTNFYFGFGYTL